MYNIYFDTEFTGLYKDTTLISLGLLTQDNKKLYLEFNDFNEHQCDDWIKKNVLDNLYSQKDVDEFVSQKLNTYGYGNRRENTLLLKDWLDHLYEDEIQLVSDCCHYDMVLFIDLFGSAFDLPKYINPACHDINQDIAYYFNLTEKKAFDLSREDILKEYKDEINDMKKHNSLYDAEVIKRVYDIVRINYN